MTQQTNLVPKRRFKEFQNIHAWEQRKLRTVAEFNPKAELPEKFEYVDLESVVGTEMIAHREESKATAPSRAQRLALQGDLFYQTVRPYQKNNYLFDKPCNNYVFSTGYAQMRPYGDGYFLLSLVQNELFVKEVLNRCTGTSYPAINSNDLADMEVSVPLKGDEQIQIGLFFKNLDNLITLQQRKLEKTKALKSAYLSEMFPAEGECVPKRRFAGFTNPWEQRKFNDLIQKLTGGASIKPDDYQESGIRTIPKGAVNSSSVADLSGSKHITHAFFEKNISSKVSTGDLVTSLRDLVPSAPNLGRIVRIKGRKEVFLMPQGVYRIELQNDVDADFMIAFSNTDKYRKIISAEKNGSTQVHIRNGDFLNIEILSPDYDEQKKIGDFFANLDNLIALHEHKLKKLQNIKKAYLNEMFV